MTMTGVATETNGVSNLSLAVAKDPTRTRLHAAFNKWLLSCQEHEYQEFLELREQIAPGRSCTIVQIIQGCELQQLPAGLRGAIQEVNLRPW